MSYFVLKLGINSRNLSGMNEYETIKVLKPQGKYENLVIDSWDRAMLLGAAYLVSACKTLDGGNPEIQAMCRLMGEKRFEEALYQANLIMPNVCIYATKVENQGETDGIDLYPRSSPSGGEEKHD